MKSQLARWMARRLGDRARELRRSLRDYQKREYTRIFDLERRSRGLRLYAAWVHKPNVIPLRDEAPESLPLPRVAARALPENVKAAA